MTVGVRWSSDNDIGVVSNDTIRDEFRSDGFPVIWSELVSCLPIVVPHLSRLPAIVVNSPGTISITS